jgi:C4-dicarboxylate transporter DctQ subunit
MMSPAMVVRRTDRFIEAIDNPIVILGLISLVSSAGLLFMEVIFRYFVGHTFPVFEELSVNLVIWAVMFFGGPVFKRGSHVGMEFLAESLHGPKKAIHQFALDVVLLFICAILFWKGIELVQLIHQTGKTTHSGELEVWYMMLAIPVGAAIYGLYGITELVKIICVFINPELSGQVFPPRLSESKASDELTK